MPKINRYHFKRLSGTKRILLLVGIVAVYAAVLFAVGAIGGILEKPDVPETVGSLDGRFDREPITYSYDGRAWEYRDRDLTNLLLVGTDWEEESAVSHRYAGQADFLLLLTLDRRNKTITPLQLDRDAMTDIRILGPFGDFTGIRKTQVCLSYAYGSTPKQNRENLVWAVSRLLGGIPIDGVITLSMSGISQLNDALGGITVTLDEDFSNLDPAMTRGTTLTLQGRQAELFVRSRMYIGDGTNVGRMRRQRAFIEEAEKRMIQGLNEDVNYVSRLLDSLSDYMTLSMDRSWLINKAYECREFSRQNTRLLEGSHNIGEDGFVEFHPDPDALSDMLTTLFFKAK